MLRLKSFLFVFFFILGVTSILSAQNDNVTITTYYPSPVGVYNQLAANRLIVGVAAATPANYGAMNDGDALVNNRLRVAQQASVATTNFRNSLTVSGNVAIGSAYNNTAAPADGLIVRGNTGLGTSSPNTALDVNGALSMRGMALPARAPAGQGRIVFDSATNTFMASENNGAYTRFGGVENVFATCTWTGSGDCLAECPAGYIVVGGGCGGNPGGSCMMNLSYPVKYNHPPRQGWVCGGACSNAMTTVRGTAVCVK